MQTFFCKRITLVHFFSSSPACFARGSGVKSGCGAASVPIDEHEGIVQAIACISDLYDLGQKVDAWLFWAYLASVILHGLVRRAESVDVQVVEDGFMPAQ